MPLLVCSSRGGRHFHTSATQFHDASCKLYTFSSHFQIAELFPSTRTPLIPRGGVRLFYKESRVGMGWDGYRGVAGFTFFPFHLPPFAAACCRLISWNSFYFSVLLVLQGEAQRAFQTILGPDSSTSALFNIIIMFTVLSHVFAIIHIITRHGGDRELAFVLARG